MEKKVFLITGASSGIGAATATHLASLGHIVYGAARRIEKLNELSKDGVKPLQLDICDTAQIQSAVQHIIQAEQRIDVLVNNAGYGSYGAIEDVPAELVRRQFEVNLFGLAEMTKAVLPYMRKRMQGRIINISSVGGVITFPLGGWYHATKFALEGWSDCLRMELLSYNIPVIVVRPGLIATEFGDVARAQVQIAKDTAYTELIDALQNMDMSKFKPSDPMVIAKVIEHAALSKKPKTRYVAGAMAKPFLFMRRMMNDMKWSKAVMNTFKIKARSKYSL